MKSTKENSIEFRRSSRIGHFHSDTLLEIAIYSFFNYKNYFKEKNELIENLLEELDRIDPSGAHYFRIATQIERTYNKELS